MLIGLSSTLTFDHYRAATSRVVRWIGGFRIGLLALAATGLSCMSACSKEQDICPHVSLSDVTNEKHRFGGLDEMERKFSFPKRDEHGWSVLVPSSDSRLIYVSASGNDTSGKAYSLASSAIGADPYNPNGRIFPYATVAAALAQTRPGYPDYIFLHRGDTFNVSSTITMHSGRSSAERQVLTSYGSAPLRPVVLNYGADLSHGSYTAIVGIRFYAESRNPESDSFKGYSTEGAPYGLVAIRTKRNDFSGGLLIEDCWFDFFVGNVIQSPENTGLERITDVIVRRTLFTNNYATASHSQGFFGERFSGWFEENIFYHNGWYQKGNNNDPSFGQATMFNHNTYFENCAEVVFRNNVFLRPSSNHNKFTSNTSSGTNQVKSWNIYLDNNLYIDGEVGISIGGNETMKNGPRWRSVNITNNVMLQFGLSRPTNRDIAWGIMDAQEWESGVIRGNIIAHFGDTTTNVNSYGLRTYRTMSETLISDNVFYDIVGDNPIVSLEGDAVDTGISFFGNVIVTRNKGRLINDDLMVRGAFSNNCYHAAGPQNGWFVRGNNNASLSDYLEVANDTSSKAGVPSYSEPDRTIDTYLKSIGMNGFSDYVSALLGQRKGNWASALQADAVNQYVRAGFGR